MAKATKAKPAPKAEATEGRRRPGPAPRSGPGLVTTTLRVTKDHHAWLRRQAFERSLATGERPDASAIVRELLDEAMAAGKGK